MSLCCGGKTIDATEYVRARTNTPIVYAWFCPRCRQVTAVKAGQIEKITLSLTVGDVEKAGAPWSGGA